MKVGSVMNKHVESVERKTPVKEVSRLIFGAGVNGVPVTKDKKVIGFITERDILSRLYPTMGEYVNDPVHSRNFEDMEERTDEIFSLAAEDIMSRNPITVTEDTPLLRAQSLMFIHKVGRLPVVDERGNLVGIISKGDIFRAVVASRMSFSLDEEYHDWLSKQYDVLTDWEKRLKNEIPDLVQLFHREKVKTVLDVGCGTGEHDIALAEKGFDVTGFDSSKFMHETAVEKLQGLSKNVTANLSFLCGNYEELLLSQKKEFDAAIFLGSAFPHLAPYHLQVLEAISRKLSKKKAIIVMQIINFEKVFAVKKRLLDFSISKTYSNRILEKAFLEYYDPPRKKGDNLTLTMSVFDFDGKNWKYRSMNSTPIANVNQEKIFRLLKKNGFSDISFYGGSFLSPLFHTPFRPRESDWLNVVAKR